MNYYFAYGLSIATEVNFPELFIIPPTATPDVSVRIGETPVYFSEKAKEHQTNIFITPTDYYLSADDVAAYYAANGNEVISTIKPSRAGPANCPI